MVFFHGSFFQATGPQASDAKTQWIDEFSTEVSVQFPQVPCMAVGLAF